MLSFTNCVLVTLNVKEEKEEEDEPWSRTLGPTCRLSALQTIDRLALIRLLAKNSFVRRPGSGCV